MGGHRQRQQRLEPAIKRGQDPDGKYEAACVEFADGFGWEPGTILYWWSQIALARMHVGQSQDVAEDGALHNVREAFDQRGRLPC